MKKRYLAKDEIVYATGAYLRYIGKGKFELLNFDEDTFYDGQIVYDIDTNKPFIDEVE